MAHGGRQQPEAALLPHSQGRTQSAAIGKTTVERGPHNLDETMENNSSFDLNAAIQRWRGELAKSSSFRADDLDELESHLRDSQASLQAHGLTAEEAFLIAVRRTGSRDALSREFAVVNGWPASSVASVWLDRLLWMTTGWLTISALMSLMTTLLFRTLLGLLLPVALGLTLFFVLRSNRLGTTLRAPLRSAVLLLLLSLLFAFLRTSF